MKNFDLKIFALVVLFFLATPDAGAAQTAGNSGQAPAKQTTGNITPVARERNIRAHMEFLAGDALQGRGSGTQFERIAAEYLASQMRQYGIEPAGEMDAAGRQSFIQTITVTRNSFAGAPKLSYQHADGSTSALEHGKEMLVLRLSAAKISGSLQKLNPDGKPTTGAIVLVRLREGENLSNLMQSLQNLSDGGAAAVLVEETPQIRAQWNNYASRKLSFTEISKSAANRANIIFLSTDAAGRLSQNADGTNIEITGTLAEPQKLQTWNAVGKLPGSDARLASEVILLSAHLDHLGVRENAPGDDKIFNGADDDASGCVAVLELARILSGSRSKRTIYFAFYGSEEAGGFGAQYFVKTLSFPKENLIANLQFEMLGRPDPKVAADELWLTGYDRSNLGAELAKQGAKLVADPHPDQNFFQRSDNYTLARQGIIAHTVSSFGLHTDYHRPSDEIETIDFVYMTRAINSLVTSIEWLVNSNFKPIWFEGKKP